MSMTRALKKTQEPCIVTHRKRGTPKKLKEVKRPSDIKNQMNYFNASVYPLQLTPVKIKQSKDDKLIPNRIS
jgi:hypothetical protein